MRLQIFFIYSNVFIFDISFDLRKKKKQTKREFHENKDEVKEPENMGISEDRSTLKKPWNRLLNLWSNNIIQFIPIKYIINSKRFIHFYSLKLVRFPFEMQINVYSENNIDKEEHFEFEKEPFLSIKWNQLNHSIRLVFVQLALFVVWIFTLDLIRWAVDSI